MTVPGVAIVIPCLNEVGYIGKCLDSILLQDYPKAQLKVLVVDGGSTDGTLDVLKKYTESHSFITHLHNPERVTPIALNRGIQSGNAEVSIILGAHSELESDFVRRNVEVLEAHPEAGCVGGVINNVYENDVARRIGTAMGSVFGVGDAHFRTGGVDAYVDTVAFGAYRREVFEKLGYFDESLVRNQDDEFNFRVIKGGFKIRLSPQIRCRYYVRGSYSGLYRQYFQYGYWKVLVNKMHGTVTTLRQVIPPLFVLGLFVGLIASFLHPVLALLYFSALAMYVFGALFAAARSGSQFADIPGIVLSFFILHIAYGAGYLEGIFHFVVLGRDPSARRTTLSR